MVCFAGETDPTEGEHFPAALLLNKLFKKQTINENTCFTSFREQLWQQITILCLEK